MIAYNAHVWCRLEKWNVCPDPHTDDGRVQDHCRVTFQYITQEEEEEEEQEKSLTVGGE